MTRTFKVLDVVSGRHPSTNKFYELALLQEVTTNGPGATQVGRVWLIRRYGAADLARVGGAIGVQEGTTADFRALERSKSKGGYNLVRQFMPEAHLGMARGRPGDSIHVDEWLRHYGESSLVMNVFGGTEPVGHYVPPPYQAASAATMEGWGAW